MPTLRTDRSVFYGLVVSIMFCSVSYSCWPGVVVAVAVDVSVIGGSIGSRTYILVVVAGEAEADVAT